VNGGLVDDINFTYSPGVIRVIDHEGNPILPADWGAYLHRSTAQVQFTLRKQVSETGANIFIGDIESIQLVVPPQTTVWRKKGKSARPGRMSAGGIHMKWRAL
jgi:hypothetical protein